MELKEKTLVASGCSFTHQSWSWAYKLKETKNCELLNVAFPCQGNNIIANKVLYNVNEQLLSKKNTDIIVGIMWSGIDRHDMYLDNFLELENIDGWEENPTGIIENHKNWLIMNSHWETPLAKMWYQNFHTYVGAMIETLKNILLVQLFLEKHQIKYFMTTFMDIFQKNDNHLLNNLDIKYFYDMINFSKFLPVDGCHEWVKINCKEKGFNKPDINGYVGIHPNSYGHERFTNEVIIPYINEIK